MRPSHLTPTRMTFRCRAYVELGSIIQAFPYYGSNSCNFMGCDDPHVWVWYTFGNFSCLDGKNYVILSWVVWLSISRCLYHIIVDPFQNLRGCLMKTSWGAGGVRSTEYVWGAVVSSQMTYYELERFYGRLFLHHILYRPWVELFRFTWNLALGLSELIWNSMDFNVFYSNKLAWL